MRHLGWILPVAWIAAAGGASAAPPVPAAPGDSAPVCSTLPDCEARLRSVAATSPNGSAGPDADRVAAGYRRLGAAAWPRIVVLSVDRDPKVRNIAGYVMGEWTPLTDEQVPAIAAALRLEPGGWPARALGTLGTPAAVAVLIEDLKRSGAANQSTFALQESLPAALPAILTVLQSGASGTQREGIEDALHSLHDEGRSPKEAQVRRSLIGAATDPHSGPWMRREATGLLLAMHDDPSVDLARLRENLSSRDERLRTTTERLLRQHGDPSVLAGLLQTCREALPDGPGNPAVRSGEVESCLDPLARMGTAAASAVPMLLERVDRVAAEQRNPILATLGYIGDSRVVPVLVAHLRSNDERDVTASLESLWRLHALEALRPIREVARSHWFAPTREFASRVAASLVGGSSTPVEEALASDFLRESLTGKHAFGLSLNRKMAAADCSRWQVGSIVVDRSDAVRASSPPPPAGLRERVPHAAHGMAFGDGALFGIDDGEFGGGLAFVSRQGRRTDLLDENVHGIVPRGNGEAFAMLGLDHMMDWGGAIVVVAQSAGGARIAERRRLPSASEEVHPVGNGWLVVMSSGDAVRVAPDLSLVQARCLKPLH